LRFNPNELIIRLCEICEVQVADADEGKACPFCHDFDGLVQKVVPIDEEVPYPHEDMIVSYNKSCYNWMPDMEDKILRITKSSVGTFDFCPKQYYFQNILGLRGEERDYHVRGSNVHDAVEWFWKESTKRLPEVDVLLHEGKTELAKKELRKAMPIPPTPYIYGEEPQMNQYSDWQFERYLHMRDNPEDWTPIGNEVEIHGTRIVVASDGTEVPIHMKGFIDRIFIDDAHTGIILMELKTGKWVEKGGRKRASMRAEMQFYRMMLEHSPHIEYLPVVGWGWQYPGGGINGGDGPMWDYENVKGPGGRYAPKTVEKRLTRIVDAHLNDDFPAQAHEAKCAYCDFMEMCPAWMGELALTADEMGL
jgi:RecB family exonuclease